MKSKKKTAGKRTSRYPDGWDQNRVRALIDHYENQTDEEAAREDDAAYADPRFTMMAVPVELVPAVQKLIARKAS